VLARLVTGGKTTVRTVVVTKPASSPPDYTDR